MPILSALSDSAAGGVLKKLSWSSIKTALQSVFATLAGVVGGQTLTGGTAASETLTLRSTAARHQRQDSVRHVCLRRSKCPSVGSWGGGWMDFTLGRPPRRSRSQFCVSDGDRRRMYSMRGAWRGGGTSQAPELHAVRRGVYGAKNSYSAWSNDFTAAITRM
jgi:hypothetical protein